MELKYVVLTIIKILISVPAVLLYQSVVIDGAALMGGHFDNKNHSINANVSDSVITTSTETVTNSTNIETESEEIPNPSPLVLPGYNLPENIFNKGKPFYLEKDPLTGKIDFDSKTTALKLDDLYDYVDEEPSSDIYDKANIDRKDGNLGSHRPSDVNQLTPNFHDFLNLPVKYNSDKYVYPLISSSYANTKIQGNVNKYHNHKDYNVKTTFKPSASPTYFSTTKGNYFNSPKTTESTTTTTTTTSTTTPSPKTTTQIYLTTKASNLMDSGINHPSFHEDFEYNYDETQTPNQIFLTTKNINDIYLTTRAPSTTTKRILNIFEQLFGEYDDPITTTEKTQTPLTLVATTPSNKNNKYESEVKTEKTSYANPSHPHYPNSHAGPNILTGSNMGLESSYEYDGEYDDNSEFEDNVAVENVAKEVQTTLKSTSVTAPLTSSTTPSSTTNTSTTEMSTTTSATTTTSTTTVPPVSPEMYDEDDHQEKNVQTLAPATEPSASTLKVTSLPLGENHVSNPNNRQSIIVATQNLREQLNNEKVLPQPFGFENPAQQPPSTSNIHIAPDQDTVSFVVGNHQNVDGGQYMATSLKESPYDSNPFRPLYEQQGQYNKDTVSYIVQTPPETYKPIQNFPLSTGSAVTIQPQKYSEASLAIGVPISSIQQVPGQVVDDRLEIDNEKIEFPKGTGTKVIFPDEKTPTLEDLVPSQPIPNREVLKLNSKPMYHQLPSDLTPPKEKEVIPPLSISRLDRPRPPWDPRPGHFYSGKPEYVRPPRPALEIAFKRIDNLPNILPQFRPNMKPNGPPHYLNRQPLLDRPSNRPVGFFEKLQPPPPPKNLHNLRKIPPPQSLDQLRSVIAEDRIINEGSKKAIPEFNFYQTPPKVIVPTRRIANLDGDVETLQMIQAKKEKKEMMADVVTEKNDDGTDKPLYVVYPVNTPPIKLDVIDTNKKENVVIGTRAELPLPPSKISPNFDYEQNPILNPKDRNDAPILKPHPKPVIFPIKSDFPYPLERPDPSVLNPAVPEVPANNGNNLDEPDNFLSNNQWNTIGENLESRIVTGLRGQTSNQISATLKTYTEKPIAVAYTPTEPHDKYNADKYSMPNYGSPVIPEIRLGTVDNAEVGQGNPDNEFTVSAVMHTHPQIELATKNRQDNDGQNHKSDTDSPSIPQLDFQAPFQASVNIDSMSQGWSVVRDKNKSTTEIGEEVTTLPLATTSEFDIENFKPQLIGGFKPIYSFPEEPNKTKEVEISEREE